jgi:23S rRNA pseudouridine1911/1915/1917 synthase
MLDVLYDDENLLVVDKPAGLVCHPTKGDERSSLIGRVRLHLGHGEGRLVNRLDRETSGVVLIAKGASVAGGLGRLLASGAVEKIYTAIVHGHPARDTLVIAAALGRDGASEVAIKDRVRDDGAPARTDARVVDRLERDGKPFSLLEITPRTGRKHQIRIHLAHAGHPIVGDKLYGFDETCYLRLVRGQLTDVDRAALLLEHHALHAARLSFTWRERRWTWTAPTPRRLTAFAGVKV